MHLSNPDTSESNALKAAVVSKVTRRLVPLLFFLYVIAYVDRINISFAALQIKAYLGMSEAGYGFAAGVFFAGYVVFQLPSNMILEKIGARRWIAVLMIAWGIISSCMIFARIPWHLYVFRFMLGSAEAGFFPGIVFYLKSWFPHDTRAKTVALFAAAGPLSAVIAGPLCGALLRLHKGGLAGWQWMFLVEGVPAILLGIGVLFYLTNTPSQAHWLSEDQRGWLIDTLSREQHAVHSSDSSGVAEVFTSASIWLLVFVYFGVNCAGYGITLWLPSFIRNLSGVGTVTIGLLTAIPYAAALVIMIIAGAHSDKSGEQRWHIAAPAFLGAAALFLAAYSSSVAALVGALSVAVVTEFSMVGPFWALSTTIKPKHAAAGIALINSIGNLGGLAGSFAVGALKNAASGFRDGLFVLGISLGMAGILALLVRRGAAAIPGREMSHVG
ncbi:MAG TPA: MFS transporter [Candidatus Sulfotelmatobacter sp.]|nr:MFS transporter [Candidatus Sulfotelmatobacter sp.]